MTIDLAAIRQTIGDMVRRVTEERISYCVEIVWWAGMATDTYNAPTLKLWVSWEDGGKHYEGLTGEEVLHLLNLDIRTRLAPSVPRVPDTLTVTV